MGRIVGTHGVRGGLRVALLSDFPSAFRRRKKLAIGEGHREYDVVHASVTGSIAVVQLTGVDTIEQAQALRGETIYVPLAEATRPRGEHFWHEIVGLRVETEDGRVLGTVTDILRTGANDVYVVGSGRNEVLIPAIADVVREVDVAGGRMVVRPLPGMLPGED